METPNLDELTSGVVGHGLAATDLRREHFSLCLRARRELNALRAKKACILMTLPNGQFLLLTFVSGFIGSWLTILVHMAFCGGGVP